MVKRVIRERDSGRKIGEIEPSSYGFRKVICDEDGRELAEIEEDIAGREIIYRNGKESGFIDNYTGKETIYTKSGKEREDVEISYEEDNDSDFNPISFGAGLLLSIFSAGIKGFYDGWRKSSHKKEDEKIKYQQKKNYEKQKLKERERLEELRRQYDLETIANSRRNSLDVRVAAVRNMTSQSELESIASNRYNNADVRVAAVRNMTSQSELESIASNRYNNADVREAASERLESLKR